jgi:hypothetical protein
LRKISLKYAGKCSKCGRWIQGGKIAYWEQGKGIWHVECYEDHREVKYGVWQTEPMPRPRSSDRSKSSSLIDGTSAIGARLQHSKFPRNTRKIRPLRSYTPLILSVACALTGLLSLGYSSSMGPLAVPETFTRASTVCVPSTAATQTYLTSVSTSSTTTYRTQSTTWTTQTLGKVGPCPYGGTYYSRLCTKLCGCQYNVCVSFDRNCGNDYASIYSYRTTVQTVRVTVTCTSYLLRTTTQTFDTISTTTSCGVATITETTATEVPNPSKGSVGGIGVFLIAVGVAGSSYGMWANRHRCKFCGKTTVRNAFCSHCERYQV